MTIFGINYLDRIIGFVGSFVGVFELVMIPSIMFLVLDSKKKLMSTNLKTVFLIAVCIIMPIYFAAAYYSITLK